MSNYRRREYEYIYLSFLKRTALPPSYVVYVVYVVDPSDTIVPLWFRITWMTAVTARIRPTHAWYSYLCKYYQLVFTSTTTTNNDRQKRQQKKTKSCKFYFVFESICLYMHGEVHTALSYVQLHIALICFRYTGRCFNLHVCIYFDILFIYYYHLKYCM